MVYFRTLVCKRPEEALAGRNPFSFKSEAPSGLEKLFSKEQMNMRSYI